MRALVVDSEFKRMTDLTAVLLESGFQVTTAHSIEQANAFIRKNVVDLLVAPEIVDTTRSHSLALLAEYRNPLVATIFLTDRQDEDVDELFLLLPSLHCLLAEDINPYFLAKLALASICSVGDSEAPYLLSSTSRVTVPSHSPTFVSVRSKPGFAFKRRLEDAA